MLYEHVREHHQGEASLWSYLTPCGNVSTDKRCKRVVCIALELEVLKLRHKCSSLWP